MKKLLSIGLAIPLLLLSMFAGGCGTGENPPPSKETAPAVKLVFTTQPTDSIAGITFTQQPVVTAQDEQGNVVTGHRGLVALTITAGAGAGGAHIIGGTQVSLVNGEVRFRDLYIDLSGSGYTLTAQSGKLAAATSSAFTVSPGAPAKLEFSVQPSTAIAGTTLRTQPEVIIQDYSGNRVTTYDGSVTLSVTPIAGLTRPVLYGTPTVKVVNGVARFTDLSIQRAFFAFTLTATSPGLTTATSNTFKILPAAPVKLEISVQPGGAIDGWPFENQPKAVIEDVYNNVVTSSTSPLTMSITPGTGTKGAVLSGATTLNAEDGLTEYQDLTIDLVGSGYTLTVTGEGLTPMVSQPFDVVDLSSLVQ